jgi:hypothetical protein
VQGVDAPKEVPSLQAVRRGVPRGDFGGWLAGRWINSGPMFIGEEGASEALTCCMA